MTNWNHVIRIRRAKSEKKTRDGKLGKKIISLAPQHFPPYFPRWLSRKNILLYFRFRPFSARSPYFLFVTYTFRPILRRPRSHFRSRCSPRGRARQRRARSAQAWDSRRALEARKWVKAYVKIWNMGADLSPHVFKSKVLENQAKSCNKSLLVFKVLNLFALKNVWLIAHKILAPYFLHLGLTHERTRTTGKKSCSIMNPMSCWVKSARWQEKDKGKKKSEDRRTKEGGKSPDWIQKRPLQVERSHSALYLALPLLPFFAGKGAFVSPQQWRVI